MPLPLLKAAFAKQMENFTKVVIADFAAKQMEILGKLLIWDFFFPPESPQPWRISRWNPEIQSKEQFKMGKRHLSKLYNIFVQIPKYICSNGQIYLSNWQNLVKCKCNVTIISWHLQLFAKHAWVIYLNVTGMLILGRGVIMDNFLINMTLATYMRRMDNG